ncbi:MAG: hypothetical protein KDJ36_01035 [Hyphomicrobiaceae bacterium]|nr:hypothetical protein [Hyphomicrobiaceae bacterium]
MARRKNKAKRSKPDHQTRTAAGPDKTDTSGYLILAACALIPLLIIAVSLVGNFTTTTRVASQIERDLTTLASADRSAPGARAFVTGTIAKDSKPLFRNFVAYVEERYGSEPGIRASSKWLLVAAHRQPLSIDTAAGPLKITNTNYRLSDVGRPAGVSVIAGWDHTGARVEHSPSMLQGARRWRGLVAGGPATAVGTLTAKGVFVAEYVVGLSRTEVLNQLGRSASLTSYLITALVLLVPLLVVVGLTVGYDRYRRRRNRA